MESKLPSLTYYNKSGALINKNKSQLALQRKVLILEQEVETLKLKLDKCLTQIQSIQSSTNS